MKAAQESRPYAVNLKVWLCKTSPWITLYAPNRNKQNIMFSESTQIPCKVLVKLTLLNFIHHWEAILPFPLSSWLHRRHSKHKIWSQRCNDCKHPNSILRKDSDIYSEAPIASDALKSLMSNNHFHPPLIQPGVCSLLLRTMCLSISLGRCFCSVGTISVSGQQTPSRVHHNKTEITQMRSHGIWFWWWVTESP